MTDNWALGNNRHFKKDVSAALLKPSQRVDVNFTASTNSSRQPSSSRLSLLWFLVPCRLHYGNGILLVGLPAYHRLVLCLSSHWLPTSRLNKDCSLLQPTTYLFLLLDCLLLDVAPSLSPALAYGMTYRSMSPQQHHLGSPSEDDYPVQLYLFRVSYPGLVL